MATKVFRLLARYVQPPWTLSEGFIDGIYVDDPFFANNIPILGAKLNVSVKPTKHLRQRSLSMTARTYHNGQTGSILLNFFWPWQDDEEQEKEVDFGDAFYGIGLNPFYSVVGVDAPTDAEVIYTVNYKLEVYY